MAGLIGALVRAIAGASVRDLTATGNVWLPLAWGLLATAGATAIATFLLPSRLPASDRIAIGVALMPIYGSALILPVALFSRRGQPVPVTAMTIFVGALAVGTYGFGVAVRASSPTVVLPVSLWALLTVLLRNGGAAVLLTFASLRLASRVIEHPSRGRMTAMALVVPPVGSLLALPVVVSARSFTSPWLTLETYAGLTLSAVMMLLWLELRQQARERESASHHG